MEQKPYKLWPIEESNNIFKRLKENVEDAFQSIYI